MCLRVVSTHSQTEASAAEEKACRSPSPYISATIQTIISLGLAHNRRFKVKDV